MNTTTPTVEQIDPRTLLIDLNVSGRNAIDKELLASIRDLGVLQPVIAYRIAGGEMRVRFGHRRALHLRCRDDAREIMPRTGLAVGGDGIEITLEAETGAADRRSRRVRRLAWQRPRTRSWAGSTAQRPAR